MTVTLTLEKGKKHTMHLLNLCIAYVILGISVLIYVSHIIYQTKVYKNVII